MLKWARIENNKIMEITEIDPHGRFTTEIVDQFVQCPQYVEQNWRNINNEWLEPELYEITLDDIRMQRNIFLRESDFTQLSDSPLSPEQKQIWATYRQQLRDFPQNVDLDNINWPVKPQD